jgi:3-deoxy-manno-octulosonate cytidylyltransferase (CMP-KDO synthetase)
MANCRFLGVIPARYASTRFPGKPLVEIGGKMMIQRVYEQVKDCLDDVVVATDDLRIRDAVVSFGGNVVMTSEDHKSGTDRCREALEKANADFDVVINIQGDEPFIQPSQIELLKSCFASLDTEIATLVKPFTQNDGLEALLNANTPKVVLNGVSEAIYFSRSVIPYLRGLDQADWLKTHIFYKHIGLYAYRTDVLKSITTLPQSSLELAESLEQLRWIENGYKIKVSITHHETIGIDTPEDLIKAEKLFL